LVIDEAYIEFAGEDHSLLTRLDHLPNVALMRTFSKVYGLAGLRIGYAILPEAIADYLWRVRLPFSLNIIAEEAALAALADAEFRQKTIDLVHRGRSLLTQELRAMGCEVLPSFSNFIMFRTPEGSVSVKTLHGELLRRGIIIRALGGYHLPDWLRVSVGTDEENALFLQYTREILGLGSSQSPMIITIDGPAGVGKSTLARRLAAELSIAYLDTGAMYRTLGLRLGAEAADLSDDQLRMRCREYHFTLESKENVASPVLCCNGVAVGSEIRTEKAGRLASLVARLPVLREELQRAQREIGMYCSLVAEGRDMGTHVFPNASCKFFLDARPQIRAERRYRELEAVGALNGATLDDICSAMESRDAQDRNRDIDPLRPAEQAVIVDTSDLDLESVFKVLLTSVQNVCTA
jgi:cytidylate kinase